MSYDKQVNNYLIKFKDEKSYLEAKLENLNLYSDIPFIGFIRNEMYDKDKCEVESIEAIATNITWDVAYSDDSSVDLYNTIAVDSYIGPGDLYLPGSTYSNYSSGEIVYNGRLSICNLIPAKRKEKNIKDAKTEPEEPIDDRFDILDL